MFTKHKSALSLLIFIVMGIFLSFLPTNKTYAQEKDPCAPKEHWLDIRPARCMFQDVGKSFGEDIRKTISNSAITLVSETPTKIMYNRSGEEMHLCEIRLMLESKNLNPNSEADIETIVSDDEQVQEVKNADCSDLDYNLIALDMGFPQETPTSSVSSRGLLTGLYSVVGGAVYKEDIPVNLAFYTKHMASKIPVVKNTAFAAAGPYDQLGTLWPMILQVWEVSKNISYGLLAVFMLYIGIMIMMRKQLDPRTTVTIQNALPKIVIAVILITFSYAIGAFGIELVKGLGQLAYRPLTGEISGVQTRPGVAATYWLIASTAIKGTSLGGVLIGILMAVVGILMLVMGLIIVIKALIAYIKIILSIWVAPVIFAWGAIPGNEDSTASWFKNLAVNVLTVPALKLGLALSLYVGWIMIEAAETLNSGEWLGGEGGANFVAGDGQIWSRIAVPLFIIVLQFWTLKIPKKLETALLDKRK